MSRKNLILILLLMSYFFSCSPKTTVTQNPTPNETTLKLVGVGGDNKIYNASVPIGKSLEPSSYYKCCGGKDFVHFTLDGVAFPNAEWGVDRNSWTVKSKNGGKIIGIGGDEKEYEAEWTGIKTLKPRRYVKCCGGKDMVQFMLDGKPFPNEEWGIKRTTVSIILY